MSDRIREIEIKLGRQKRSGVSVSSTMSWDTFEQYLRDTGRLHHNEILDNVVVSDHGIRWYIGDAK